MEAALVSIGHVWHHFEARGDRFVSVLGRQPAYPNAGMVIVRQAGSFTAQDGQIAVQVSVQETHWDAMSLVQALSFVDPEASDGEAGLLGPDDMELFERIEGRFPRLFEFPEEPHFTAECCEGVVALVFTEREGEGPYPGARVMHQSPVDSPHFWEITGISSPDEGTLWVQIGVNEPETWAISYPTGPSPDAMHIDPAVLRYEHYGREGGFPTLEEPGCECMG